MSNKAFAEVYIYLRQTRSRQFMSLIMVLSSNPMGESECLLKQFITQGANDKNAVVPIKIPAPPVPVVRSLEVQSG